jgi:hypothetical protein
MSNLSDSFFLSFTHPIANGFAPPILGRDIGITFEEIQVALDSSMEGNKVGLITTPADEQNISMCMAKLKLMNPVQRGGEKRVFEGEEEEGLPKRQFEDSNAMKEDGKQDVMELTDEMLRGGGL